MALSYLTNKPCTTYNFRRSNNIIVPRFNSQFLKNGTLSRVILQTSLLFFIAKSRRTLNLRNLILAHRHYQDFKCFKLFYVLNAVVNSDLEVTNVNSF